MSHLGLEPDYYEKSSKRLRIVDEEEGDDVVMSKNGKTSVGCARSLSHWQDPACRLASARHEFGEHGGVNMSIEASATFTVMEPETLGKLFTGELGPDSDYYVYSRHFNPTVLNLSRRIAAIEGTEAAYCTSSGMSAIACVILQLCGHGDHIVASSQLYGGTFALLSHFLPRTCGIMTTFVDIGGGSSDEIAKRVKEAIISKPSTKILYLEAMSNPTLSIPDIPTLSAIAHDVGSWQGYSNITVVVDNTFAPMVLSPVKLGADVVVHSLTKYVSGGGDIIAGAVCGPSRLINDMMGLTQGAMMLLGPTMNPKAAFELSERLPHLALRMKEQCHRAMTYAMRLRDLGLKVIYPGLEEHPQHKLLKRLANQDYGFGGILGLVLSTKEQAYQLIHYLQNNVRFGFIAVSLGYYETLMSCPGSSTSSEMSQEEQEKSGISPGLIRMSVGYSGTLEQRWKQLHDALTTLNLVS